ncbi:MAG: MlaD family protein [Bacteroidota bacterium]
MKKDTGNKIKLGIFISIGMMVFIVGIYFIGEGQQLFTSTFRISGIFSNVAGLQAGNNVRLSGINVGVVDNISIVSDTTVRVDILIDERTRKFIRKDAVASISSEGLIGNKALIISPGTGGTKGIEDGDSIATVQPMGVEDLLLSLKATIDNTNSITNDLAMITGTIQSGKGTIGKLLMDKSLVENIDSTLANVKEGSAGLVAFMEKVNAMDTLLTSIKATIDHTANITSDLSKITNAIQSGEGTLGKLLMDQTLGQNLDSTLVNLKEGSAGLRAFMEMAKRSWLLWGF